MDILKIQPINEILSVIKVIVDCVEDWKMVKFIEIIEVAWDLDAKIPN